MIIVSEYFLVAVIFAVSFVILAEDWKTGKIRNKWLALGFISGLFCYLFLAVWSFAGYWGITAFSHSFFYYPSRYFLIVAANFGLSVLVSFLFWQYRLWSAGDAKFFILLSFLLPLKYYSKGFLPYFPSSALLANIFMPIFLFLAAGIIVDFFVNIATAFYKYKLAFLAPYWEGFKVNLKNNAKNKKKIFVFGVSFTLTFVVIPLIRSQITPFATSIFKSSLVIFAGFYFLHSYSYEFIREYVKKRWFLVLAAGFIFSYFIAGYLYFYESLALSFVSTLKGSFGFMFLLMIFKRMADFYVNNREIKTINAEDLAPKMIISEELMEEIKNDKDIYSQIGDLHLDGLAAEQIELLKPWLLKTNKSKVAVYKTFAFAPWIFAGVLLTLILKQSVLHFVLGVIK